MKRVLLLLACFSAVAGFAAQSTMNMVTYFPVPYVSYNNIYVNNQLDVGLGNVCDWTVGNSSLTSRSGLTVTNKTAVTGKLTLNTPLIVSSGLVTIGGNGSSSTPGVKFKKNLRIASMSGGFQSIQTKTLDVGGYGIELFPDKFDLEDKSEEAVSKSLTNCGNTCVHWEKLTRKDGTKGIYLVYGNSTDSASCAGMEASIERCTGGGPSGHIGTWNYDTCVCECPSGTVLSVEDGWCDPVCENEQQNIDLCTDASYSGTGYTGTWNQDTCSCTCQSGSHWEDGEGCVGSSCQWGSYGGEWGAGNSSSAIGYDNRSDIEREMAVNIGMGNIDATMNQAQCEYYANALLNSQYGGGQGQAPQTDCNKSREGVILGIYDADCWEYNAGVLYDMEVRGYICRCN